MTRSLNSYQKDRIKDGFGCKCYICNTRREKKFLDVHHINAEKYTPNYNQISNLMVLCNRFTDKNCHAELHDILKGGELERERKKDPEIKKEVDYQGGSVEMQVNDFAEIRYRKWINVMLSRHGKYLKKECIYGGAEICEISPTTTRKYLEKMISGAGALKEKKDPDNKRKYILYKDGLEDHGDPK